MIFIQLCVVLIMAITTFDIEIEIMASFVLSISVVLGILIFNFNSFQDYAIQLNKS